MRVAGDLVEEVLASSLAADAHADSLMWNRDLTVRSEAGHLDFPRLVEGRVRLQCFTVVTRGLPFIDGFSLFARWRRWPASVRGVEWLRALWQIEALERLCAASGGLVRLAHARKDLEAAAATGHGIAAVLGIEGAHALGGRPERVGELWRRGVRFMSLLHLSDNELGGSATFGRSRRGLTMMGHEVLREMARVGMIVDLAHSSPRTIDETLAEATGPVFCSHTGLHSATAHWRNLRDEHTTEIARRGGVVCVMLATSFLGGKEVRHLVGHLERALAVAGEDHVGLGGDYDGFVELPRGIRDVRDLRVVVRALLESGLDRPVVEKVLGRNLRRFLAAALPPDAPDPAPCYESGP